MMQLNHEAHEQDGVVLCFCFLKHCASRTNENLIEAFSQLSDSKLKLWQHFKFINNFGAPVHFLLKLKEIFFHLFFYLCMAA
jgi:hypothetical protein